MYKTNAPLVLASASPRRSELLSRLGLVFDIAASNLEEQGDGPDPAESAMEWARQKAVASARKLGKGECFYLGADTIVVIDGLIIGKPGSPGEAADLLRALSGRWHRVVSGYCISRPARGDEVARSVSSKVKIKELEQAEIEAYVSTGEPLDKAGAYAVQGTGAFMVERIEGSYTNVIGLPLSEVTDDFKRLGIIEPAG